MAHSAQQQKQQPINLLEGLDLAGQDQQTNQAPINLLEGLTTQPQAQQQPEQQIQARQQAQQALQPAQETSFSDQALGAVENVASLVSGAVAEPIAGIAGIAQAINPFA
ncbi:MAG TPA: hypothetical protein EYN67_15320, partial [Flavobacteriales bacterium]|nr:hypothetical protein [Flavobacteriales bacterium]